MRSLNARWLLSALMAASVISIAKAQDFASPAEHSRLGLLKRASLLLNKKVSDDHEHTVGKLEDLVMTSPGRVGFVLVGNTPVPAEISSDASVDRLVLHTSKKMFASAPQVPQTEPVKAPTPDMFQKTAVHFGVQTEMSAEANSQWCRVSVLLGFEARSRSNEPLGKLKEVMVDLPLGKAVYYIIEPKTEPGVLPDYYVVPAHSVRLNIAAKQAIVEADAATFFAGPQFKNAFWNDLALPGLAFSVQKHYASGTPTPQQPASAAVASVQPPAAQSPAPGRSDRELNQAVLSEIVQTATGFRTMNLVVTTSKGRVTLAGLVRTHKQKEQIVAAARRVVGAANVDDQLEVGTSKSAKL